MTKTEFAAWTAVTGSSRECWTLDEITYRNRGEMLFYRGGDNGQFISIDQTGHLETGEYIGAIPHVGEATFFPRFRKQFASREAAYQRVVECGGAGFLLETICRVPGKIGKR